MREEFEPEEHPYFVCMGQSGGTAAKAQMIGAFLAYACPGGSLRCSEGGQAATSEFVLRRPGARCRRRGRSIDSDSFDLPSHLADDAIDCAHDVTGGFPEGSYRGYFLVADAAGYQPGQVLRDRQRHQWVACRRHADRQPLTDSTGNVDADVDGR